MGVYLSKSINSIGLRKSAKFLLIFLSEPLITSLQPMAAPEATYKIYVTAIRANNLITADKKGKSDPYVLLQLRGKADLPKVRTEAIENNNNPEWNQALDPLPGYAVSSDVVKVLVYDKDGESGKGDDVIGAIDLPVRDLQPGKVVEHTLTLGTTNSDGKYKSIKGRKDAGTVTLKIHVAQPDATPYEDSEFPTSTLTAIVTFVSAVGVPKSDGFFNGGKSDPFVKASIKPGANKQKQETRAIKNTLKPKWNEAKRFYLQNQDQVLKLKLFDYDSRKGNKNDKLAVGEVALSEFQLGEAAVERDVVLARVDKYQDKADQDTVLKIKVKIEGTVPKAEGSTPGIKVIEGAGDCDFAWGDYGSSYSTNFSGYSKCSEVLSDLHPSEEEIHIHVAPDPVEKPDKDKVRVKRTITGKVVGATGLIKAEPSGTDSYARVELKIGSKKHGEPGVGQVAQNTQDPTWEGADFNYSGVVSSAYLLITVYQKSEVGPIKLEYPIGVAKVKVKDFPSGAEGTVEASLDPPVVLPKVRPLPQPGEWGKITVSATATDEEAAPPAE
jgi:hypothetical protein